MLFWLDGIKISKQLETLFSPNNSETKEKHKIFGVLSHMEPH